MYKQVTLSYMWPCLLNSDILQDHYLRVEHYDVIEIRIVQNSVSENEDKKVSWESERERLIVIYRWKNTTFIELN